MVWEMLSLLKIIAHWNPSGIGVGGGPPIVPPLVSPSIAKLPVQPGTVPQGENGGLLNVKHPPVTTGDSKPPFTVRLAPAAGSVTKETSIRIRFLVM